MNQPSLFIKCNDGRQIEIRSPLPEEAKQSLDLMVEIATYSPYILSTADKFKQRTVESQEKFFQENIESPSSIFLAAYFDGKMIGICNGKMYTDVKRKHRAALGIALLPSYQRLGIGKLMMNSLIENIKRFPGIKIIELEVMTKNVSALNMYKNFGFKPAGIFPNAFLIPGGEVSDNLTMYLEV